MKSEMNKAKSFQDLVVWQKAHQFALAVYILTRQFPKSELYGLTTQLRRAATSVPANIAEGFKRRGKADKARFLNVAQSSLEECRYYLILSKDLGYCGPASENRLLEQVSKLLERYSNRVLASLR